VTNCNPCPHQWSQTAPFTPAWALSIPPTIVVCPPPNHTITPNPILPSSATLPIYTPLELKKTGPCTILVTVSIPAESIFTMPTKALEIKMIKKQLKTTQCRYFSGFPTAPGIPNDTSKLFVEGYIRKDIQYCEAIGQTATTVEGVIKDFLVKIPFTCVIDLGNCHAMSPVLFNHQQEYEYSDHPTEFNLVSQQFLNSSPKCELIFSQINEMDEALDRVVLPGGPADEGVFKMLQEKMVILIQLRLTFPTEINPPHPPCPPEPPCPPCPPHPPCPIPKPCCKDDPCHMPKLRCHCCKKVCCTKHASFFSMPARLLHFIRKGIPR